MSSAAGHPDPARIPPIHRRLVVPTGPDDAFRRWTDEIGRWWPLDRFSVFGAGATVSFEGGQLVERGPDGDTSRTLASGQIQ